MPATAISGLVAGDNVVAHFAFENGVEGLAEFYRSPGQAPRERGPGCCRAPTASSRLSQENPVRCTSACSHYPAPVYDPTSTEAWQEVSLSEEELTLHGEAWPAIQQIIRSIDEMVHCLEEDREHVSDGRAGRAALEMIQAVYRSHFTGKRIDPAAR